MFVVDTDVIDPRIEYGADGEFTLTTGFPQSLE